MQSTLKLFRAVPIKEKKDGLLDKKVLSRTIKSGFALSSEIFANYSGKELDTLVTQVEKEIGLSGKQANSSFHKSWKKVKEADIEQLVLEQLVHYFTTYGMERLGLYDENFIYIPTEELKIPKININKIPLILIKGYTKEELQYKLMQLLGTGIAFADDTIKAIIDVVTYVGFNPEDIDNVKNKEVKIALYDYLNIVPENPVEFLRYVVYRATNKTLLIKDAATIDAIKTRQNLDVLGLFARYSQTHKLENLATIFYRFKPIFLAFRTNRQLKTIINKIRKLATTYHKPMPEDFLNEITAKIKRNEKIDEEKLIEELSKVNCFRKIRLAYALNYRMGDVESILYKIRNGKAYAADFNFDNFGVTNNVLATVKEYIINDLKKNIKGKKIYIPDNIQYALPATEKQFTGQFPSGTCIKLPKNMVFGVYWENVSGNRIDLDLSLIDANNKFGWDGRYRNDRRTILFSGDMTDAANGASELFYIQKQSESQFLVCLNYYNYDSEIEVPIKIFVGSQEIIKLKQNYMVNPNNVIATAETKINNKQMVLGLVVINKYESKFYFSETSIGKSITANNLPYVENTRKYLRDFYSNTINLEDLLVGAGAEFVDEENCDINLSPQKLEKDTIINLLRN